MRLKRKLTVWSSALALSCAALSVGVAQAQAQQAQAPASAKQEEPSATVRSSSAQRAGPADLRGRGGRQRHVESQEGAARASDHLDHRVAEQWRRPGPHRAGGGGRDLRARPEHLYSQGQLLRVGVFLRVLRRPSAPGGGPAGRAPDLGAGADGRAGAVRRVGHRGDPAEVRRVGGCAGHHVQHAVQDMYFFTPQEIAKYGINRVGPTQASASGAQQGGGQRAAPAPAPAPQQQTSAPAPAPQQQTSAPAGEAKLPRASRLPPARRRSPIRT